MTHLIYIFFICLQSTALVLNTLSLYHVSADEAVEKLVMLASESDGEKESMFSVSTGANMQARPISIPTMPPSHPSRRSRLPTGPTEDQGMTMLSPKTPSMVGAPTFPEMLYHQQSSGPEHNMQSAMDLLDSYPRQQMHQYSEPTYDQGPSTPLYNTSMFTMTDQQPLQSSNFPMNNIPQQQQTQTVYAGVSYASQQDPQGLSLNVAQSGLGFSSHVSPGNFSVPQVSNSNQQQQLSHSQQPHLQQHNQPQVLQPMNQQHARAQQTQQQSTGGHQFMSHNSQSPEADNHPNPNLPYFKRTPRKKTLSLNPEEREALENLIEDVIIAVDDDSEDTTSESEEEKPQHHLESNKGKGDGQNSPNTASNQQLKSPHNISSTNKGRETKTAAGSSGATTHKVKPPKIRDTSLNKEAQKVLAAASADPQQKVYPPQLKVAVKHMKNLPPRFLRKLQNNPKDDSGSSSSGGSKSDSDMTGGNVGFSNVPVSKQQQMTDTHAAASRTKVEKEKQNEQEKKTVESQDSSGVARITRTKEEQKLEKKKRIRGMLEGYDDSDKKSDQDLGNNGARAGDTKSPNLSPHAYEGGDVNNKVNSSSDSIIQHLQQMALSSGRPQLPNAPRVDELERDFLQKPTVSGIQSQQQQQQPHMQQQAGQLHQQQQQIMEGFNHNAFLTGGAGSPVSPGQQEAQSGISFGPQQSMQPPPHRQHHVFMYGQQQQQQFKPGSQFSVDAPEFVPRSFTPGALMDPQYQQQTPPMHHPIPPPQAVTQQQAPPPLPPNALQPYMAAVAAAAAAQGAPPPSQAPPPHLQPDNYQAQGRNSPAPTFLIPKMQPSSNSQQMMQQQQYQQQQQYLAAAAAAAAVAVASYPGNGNGGGGFPPPAFTQPPPPPPQAVGPGVSQQQQAQQQPQQQPQQFHNAAPATAVMSNPFLVHPWSGGKSPPLPIASVTHSNNLSSPTTTVASNSSPLQSSMVSSSSSSKALSLAQRVVQQGTVRSVRDNKHHQQQGGTQGGPPPTNTALLTTSQHQHPIMSPKMAKRGQHELTAPKARDRIKSLVNGGKHVIVLLRGPPGSGKSTLAK